MLFFLSFLDVISNGLLIKNNKKMEKSGILAEANIVYWKIYSFRIITCIFAI